MAFVSSFFLSFVVILTVRRDEIRVTLLEGGNPGGKKEGLWGEMCILS
jgi:hypothetical protein